jgi:hypothetical protein
VLCRENRREAAKNRREAAKNRRKAAKNRREAAKNRREAAKKILGVSRRQRMPRQDLLVGL